MVKNVTQNSIESYVDMIDTGELGDRQKEILDFIMRHPNCSYNDVARVMHLHHNTVTARIKELRDMGYIVCSGTKVDEFTNKTNNVYRLRREGESPDVTINDARPVLPREVIDFLKKAVRGLIIADTLEIIKGNIRYKVVKIASKHDVDFEYGEFVKLSGISIVCEDNARNEVVLSGIGYTVKFRIN